MAERINIFFIVLMIIIMSSLSLTLASSKFVSPQLKSKRLTHLHFFFHDITSGENQTAVIVANASNANGMFGTTTVFDNPLTVEYDLSSKQVGRAQGIYSFATLPSDDTALLMVMNFVFTQGKYNGSTLSVLGRNAVPDKVREMPIVGGTGRFRFATGYVLAQTHVASTIVEAIVEYNVYVLSY